MKLVWVNVWGAARVLRFATLVVMGSAAAGCIDDFDHPKGYGRSGGASAYDCRDLCSDSRRCDSDASEAECRSQCASIERIVDDAGCERAWDDVLDCAGSAPGSCETASNVCADELEDFTTCLSNYCSTYPEDCNF
jgi:hypothetical protein